MRMRKEERERRRIGGRERQRNRVEELAVVPSYRRENHGSNVIYCPWWTSAVCQRAHPPGLLAARKEEREREKEREKGEPMARRPGLYEWAIAMQPFASFVSYLSPFIIIRPHPIYTRDPRSTLYTA